MTARLFAISLIVAASAAAEAPPPRQPTGKWVAEYAESMCVLQREYGTTTSRLTLAFQPQPMSDHVALYIFDPPAKLKGEYVPVKIGFGPGFPAVDANMATFDVRAQKFRYNSTGLARPELERAAASEQISLHADGHLSVAFQVPDLRKALSVLDECVADLLVQWGFSREQQQMLAKLAEPEKPLLSYIKNGDYPDQAIRAGESGLNGARFNIGLNGRAANCKVVESSGSSSLDMTICSVTRRFRFRPAIDKAGQPMESLGYFRVRWALGS